MRVPVEVEGDVATPAPDADRAPLGEQWRRLATRLRGRLLRPPPMDMHAYPRDETTALLQAAGATVVDVAEDDCCGADWLSYRYACVKRNDA